MNLLQEKTLSQLPDEVLGLVFSFLTVCEIATCARVCQQWRKLSWYWQLVLNLEPVHENVTDTTLAWIADHCKQISSLSLCRCFSITDRGLWHLYCLPKLVHQIDFAVMKSYEMLAVTQTRLCGLANSKSRLL